MAWAVHREWDRKTASRIKRDLSLVAQTISRYEPVRMMAPRGTALREASNEFGNLANITVVEAPVDDFWMRDVMPTFALRREGRAEQVVAIDWNFNGWGGGPDRPLRAGDNLAKTAASIFGVPRVSVSFVAEGGAIVTDGDGTLITTRSCLLNSNRNPVQRGINRERTIEAAVSQLGIRRVIWLEGDPCEPITSGHTDGYVMCAPDRTVLVERMDDEDCEPPFWRDHDIAMLEDASDADDRAFAIRTVQAPRQRFWRGKGDPDHFAPCYLNAYVAIGAVIAGRYHDQESDAAAQDALAAAFPGRDVVQLEIDAIANAGGGIHCLTQPMPLLAN
jgi:agmatine deiminase